MIRIYVVISYIESVRGNSQVKTIEGYTFVLRSAQLYVDTHVGDFDILVYEGQYEYELFSSIFEDFGYNPASDSDEDMMIRIMESADGSIHIADTQYNIDTLLSEVGVFEEIERVNSTGFMNMCTLSRYMRDANFGVLLRYLSAQYLHELISWLENCTDYVYRDTLENYPLDIVSVLAINGYLTPLENIKRPEGGTDQ